MASRIPLLSDTITTPPFVALRPYFLETSYISYSDDETAVIAEGVFSPLVKIAVETAKAHEAGRTFVNLRFCYSNRYIGKREGSLIPNAELTQPDEDMTSTTSTVFELSSLGTPYSYMFIHLQSGNCLILNEAHDTLLLSGSSDLRANFFNIVDWQSLVKLPPRVAFKGDNGSYLKGYSFNGLPYLQFSSDDPNSDESVHEVELLNDGFVKIKCDLFNNYWRNGAGDSWILADSQDSSTTEKSLRFWPVQIDVATIALRSVLNNNFCVNLTVDDTENCLNAYSQDITTDSHLVVQELVSERNISEVTYRMDDARIFNETPYTAGTTMAVNETDEEATISVSLTYTDSTSHSFSNSTSLTTGVNTTIEANLLDIIKGSVQTSIQVSETLEWGQTTTVNKTVTATGTVTVPPMTSATVYYIGTLGTCDVPFNYKKQDKSSTDGSYSYTTEVDGIYTGVNAYDFSFQFDN